MLPRLIAKQISKLTRYLLRNFDSSRRPPHIRSTKIGFEGEGNSDFIRRHGRGKRPMSIVQRPILNSELRFRIFLALDVQCSMLDVRRFRADLWMKSFLKYWLPVLGWLVVTFLGSTNVTSVQNTSRFIVPFLLWLKPGMTPQTNWVIIVFMRTCAHVGEYAVLALLVCRALRWGISVSMRMPTLYGVVLLGCALFAASDEFHQTFVKSRTPSVRDVLLDIGGASLGLLIAASFANRRPKNSRTSTQGQFVDARL
jgi:VanZ family protein